MGHRLAEATPSFARLCSASWFETRGVAALLTMRVGDPHPRDERNCVHPWERALARVLKDAAPSPANALAGKFSRQHLFENLPADGLVGQRGVMPPPAVRFHFFRRR